MQKHIIPEEATILDALDKINRLSGGAMTLVVADPEGKITGTLTDGDIRRGLLRGTGLADPVKDLVHRRFMALHVSASADERLQTMRRAREAGIRLLPEIDADGRLAGLVDLSTVRSQLPLTAVLMAGGRGERLRPLTLNTPKPLLEIGGRAIIDYNIENLARNGVKDVYVTVKYLADMMRGYFSRPRHGIMARCIEEESPLGTLGAVSLVNLPPQGHTLVMNSDLLTTIDLEEMYLHHISEGGAGHHCRHTLHNVGAVCHPHHRWPTGDRDSGKTHCHTFRQCRHLYIRQFAAVASAAWRTHGCSGFPARCHRARGQGDILSHQRHVD